MPELSVIIPVYNVESYLERCVNSVRRQTWKDLEIILVDDGSEDGSLRICEQYAAMDSRIRVIHQENKGLSAARNAGLGCAGGTYIGFVDSDDWIDEDFYSHLIQLAKNEDADMVSCRFIRTGISNKHTDAPFREKVRTYRGEDALELFLDSAIKGSNILVPCWSKLYRKSKIEAISFLEGKIFEDAIFNFDVLSQAVSLTLTNYAGYYYFKNPDSITGNAFPPRILDLYDCGMHFSKQYRGGSIKIQKKIRQFQARNDLSILYRLVKARHEDGKLLESSLKGVKKNFMLLVLSNISWRHKLALAAFKFTPLKVWKIRIRQCGGRTK